MNQEPSSQEELIYQLALSLSPQIGCKTARKLLEHFGTAKEIFASNCPKTLQQIASLKQQGLAAIINKQCLDRAAAELAFASKEGIQVISISSNRYPKRLKHYQDAPIVLYYKGTAPLNPAKIVAIVGTRKPSTRGRMQCERLVSELQQYNLVVVSGLAYGIDVCAHQKCQQLNIPNIGVVAHGLDSIYPKGHRKIADKMLKNGGLLSEFPSKTQALPQHFPMRNRIIAGMVDAVIVVETALKGGSMITAKIAADYSKDVFALPGSVDDALSKGCNHLIKSHKASLLEGAKDIAYHLRWKKPKKGMQQQLFVQLSKKEQQIVDLLVGKREMHLDQILGQTAINSSQLASILLELELKGIVRPLAGKSFRLQ